MSSNPPQIHPEARIEPGARIDATARIGPGAVVEANTVVGPHCVIGAGTRLRSGAMIIEHTRLGEHNDVHPYAVLGGDPQDKAFKGDIRGELHIGDRNIFREFVTINRGTNTGPPTTVGSGNYFMAGSHAGHNAQIADNCVMVNNSAIAGHARIGSGVVMSNSVGVHQFVNVGDGVMFQAGSSVSMHVPPYVVVASGINILAGLNRVGMQRNPSLTAQDRLDVKDAYRALFRTRKGEPRLDVARQMLGERAWSPAGKRFLEFVCEALTAAHPRARGLCGPQSRKRSTMTAGDAE